MGRPKGSKDKKKRKPGSGRPKGSTSKKNIVHLDVSHVLSSARDSTISIEPMAVGKHRRKIKRVSTSVYEPVVFSNPSKFHIESKQSIPSISRKRDRSLSLPTISEVAKRAKSSHQILNKHNILKYNRKNNVYGGTLSKNEFHGKRITQFSQNETKIQKLTSLAHRAAGWDAADHKDASLKNIRMEKLTSKNIQPKNVSTKRNGYISSFSNNDSVQTVVTVNNGINNGTKVEQHIRPAVKNMSSSSGGSKFCRNPNINSAQRQNIMSQMYPQTNMMANTLPHVPMYSVFSQNTRNPQNPPVPVYSIPPNHILNRGTQYPYPNPSQNMTTSDTKNNPTNPNTSQFFEQQNKNKILELKKQNSIHKNRVNPNPIHKNRVNTPPLHLYHTVHIPENIEVSDENIVDGEIQSIGFSIDHRNNMKCIAPTMKPYGTISTIILDLDHTIIHMLPNEKFPRTANLLSEHILKIPSKDRFGTAQNFSLAACKKAKIDVRISTANAWGIEIISGIASTVTEADRYAWLNLPVDIIGHEEGHSAKSLRRSGVQLTPFHCNTEILRRKLPQDVSNMKRKTVVILDDDAYDRQYVCPIKKYDILKTLDAIDLANENNYLNSVIYYLNQINNL